MKKFFEYYKFITELYRGYRENQDILNNLKKGSNSKIEYPFFEIVNPKTIQLGNNTSIGKNAWLGYYGTDNTSQNIDPSLLIGNNVRIGNYSCITFIDKIIIGDGCLFSDYVYISDHTHGFNPSDKKLIRDQPLFSKGRVEIGNNCFVGMRATILPGVMLGNYCIVGSHAVVTKSFPAYSMIAGAPARLIKSYSFEKQSWIES